MPAQPLVIKIDSQVSGAITGIKQVEGSLNRLPAAISNATGGMNALSASTNAAGSSLAGLVTTLAPVISSFLAFAAIGIATKAIQELVNTLVGAKSAFTEIDVVANDFKITLDRIASSADNLKDRLNFNTAIQSLQNKLKFGTGAKTDILNLGVENENLRKFSDGITIDINKIENTLNRVAPKLKADQGEIGKAIAAFGGITKIPKEVIEKFSFETDKLIVEGFQKASKELDDLQQKRLSANEQISKNELQIQIIGNEEQKKLNKKRLDELEKANEKEKKIRLDRLDFIRESLTKGVIGELQGEVDPSIEEGIKDRAKALEEQRKALDKLHEAFQKVAENDFKRIQTQAQETADTISNALGNSLNSFIDAFRAGQNPIKAFFNAIANSIQQLITQLITAAIRSFILKKLLSSSLAFAGGGPLSFFNFAGFAEGGSVFGNKPIIVGEKGPEIFVPNTSGSIIPNNRLSSLSGAAAQMVAVSVTGRLSGRDIILSGAREGRYQSRNV